jgi:hypothetical protein
MNETQTRLSDSNNICLKLRHPITPLRQKTGYACNEGSGKQPTLSGCLVLWVRRWLCQLSSAALGEVGTCMGDRRLNQASGRPSRKEWAAPVADPGRG